MICNNLSHGITCLDDRYGSGAYCRVCPRGHKVSPEDVKKRVVLERLRASRISLRRLNFDYPQFIVQPWMEVLAVEAEKILGSPDPTPTRQASKL